MCPRSDNLPDAESFKVITSLHSLGKVSLPVTAVLRRGFKKQPRSINCLVELFKLRKVGLHFFKCITAQGYEGYGVSLSRDAAILSALGEAVEREALSAPEKLEVRTGPYCQLPDGERFSSLELYSVRQYAALKSQFNNPYKEKIKWRKIYCYTEDIAPRYWPADLISFSITGKQRVAECTSTGSAAAPTIRDAVLAGALEVIERDAVVYSFWGRDRIKEMRLETVPMNCRIILQMLPSDTHCRILKLDDSLGISTFLSLIWQEGEGGYKYGIGASAALDSDHAVLKALTESIFTFEYAHQEAIPKPKNAKSIRTLAEHFGYYQRENFSKLFSFTGRRSNYTRSCCTELKLFLALKKEGFAVWYTCTPGRSSKQLGMITVRVVIPGMLDLNLNPSLFRRDSRRFEKLNNLMSEKGIGIRNLKPHPFS